MQINVGYLVQIHQSCLNQYVTNGYLTVGSNKIST